MTGRSAFPIPAEVGDHTSTPTPGRGAPHRLYCRQRWSEPPSGRSSRSTDVMTAYLMPLLWMACATRSGSKHRQHRPGRRSSRAVATGARAGVSENHERAVPAIPAVADIGASCLFATGVEGTALIEGLQLAVSLAARRGNLDHSGKRSGRGARSCIVRVIVLTRIPPAHSLLCSPIFPSGLGLRRLGVAHAPSNARLRVKSAATLRAGEADQ